MTTVAEVLIGAGHTRIELIEGGHGHLLVDVLVDGAPGRMILDTGASRTILDSQAAATWGIVGAAHDEQGTGAGGEVAMQVTEVDDFTVGPMSCGALPLLITDLGPVNDKIASHGGEPVQGVLGAEILHAYGAVIDYCERSLYLAARPVD